MAAAMALLPSCSSCPGVSEPGVLHHSHLTSQSRMSQVLALLEQLVEAHGQISLSIGLPREVIGLPREATNRQQENTSDNTEEQEVQEQEVQKQEVKEQTGKGQDHKQFERVEEFEVPKQDQVLAKVEGYGYRRKEEQEEQEQKQQEQGYERWHGNDQDLEVLEDRERNTKTSVREDSDLAKNNPDVTLKEFLDDSEAEPVHTNVFVKSEEKSDILCMCGKKLANYVNFNNHIQKFHVDEQFIICSTCGIEINKQKKGEHKRQYHKTRRHCDYKECEYNCATLGILRRHVNKIHLNLPRPRNYICDDCGKAFLLPFHLRDHIEIEHKGKRDFKCDECGKTFARKKHLWAHSQVHSANPKYSCPTCGKRFRSDGALWNHKKLHQRGQQLLRGDPRQLVREDKRWINNMMNIFMFLLISRLQCGGCTEDVMLVSKEKWEQHMKALHPAGMPHWCDQCNYTFLTEDDLRSHNKKYHASQGAKTRKHNIVK